MTFQVRTDSPLTDKSKDYFQRHEFSKRIAQIATLPFEDKSLVIGLYGKWGEGKSTVINFIRDELPKETIVVNFNPWLFSDENHLLKSFFDALSVALNTEVKNPKEKLGELLHQYADAIGILSKWAGYPLNPDKIRDAGKKLNQPLSIESIKNRIDQYITQSNKKIVVFIDDIDRLDVNEIQCIFKLVKLVGDFPNTSYILSFDDEMVSAALDPKYAGKNNSAGYNFLEKIIQIPVLIPKATTKLLRRYTLDLLNGVLNTLDYKLDESDLVEYIEVFDISFLPLIDNPRIGIRYTNALILAFPMLKGEVNSSDLMIIEGVKIFYPELYSFIRNNRRLFLGLDTAPGKKLDEQVIKERIGSTINSYNSIKKNGAIELLTQIFPQLHSIYKPNSFSSLAYKSEEWTKDKRVCSGKYFDRYFSYVIDISEISDNVFKEFLEDSKNDTREELVTKTKELIDKHSAFDLLQMFRVIENSLEENQMKSLGYAISKNGNYFPIEEDILIATSFAQSARMLTRFIRRISISEQLTFAVDLITHAGSVNYGVELAHWLTTPEKNQTPPLIFDDKQLQTIKLTAVSLFKKHMNKENFFNLLPNGDQCRLLKWWDDSKEDRKSLHDFLDKHIEDTQFALDFLKMVTPTITVLSTGSNKSHTFKSGFEKAEFDLLKQLISVEKLNDALTPVYGMRPYKEDISLINKSNQVELDDKTLVSVFQWYLANN